MSRATIPRTVPRRTSRPAWELRGLVVAGLALVGAAAGAHAGDPLYYFVEGQGVVITNTPSRSDVLPVMKPAVAAIASVGAGAALPATRYDAFIANVAAEAGLSPQLIKAVALVESNLDARAVSPKGAQGLMQLMPATARAYGVTDAFDPRQNLRAGATHLRDLLDEFDGNVTLALAAYNAGSAAVRRYGGVPEYRETQDYVKRIHARLSKAPASAVTAPPVPPAEPVRLIRRPDGSVTLEN